MPPKFGWPHAEVAIVQKSPYVILCIGVVGCLALAWMARHVHSQATVRRQAQPAAVRAAYQVHLVSPVSSRVERQGGTVRRFVTAHAVRGYDGRKLAEWIARDTQATAFGALQGCAVHVTVHSADGAPPAVFELPARPPRPPRSAPSPAQPPPSPAAPR
jgi:hypothetical protein